MSAPELLGARRLRELFDERGLRPQKALGQNFVVDPNTIRKMISIAGIGADDRVLEIGAGAGSLTVGLAAAAAEVVAVEFDRRLIPVLEEAARVADNVEIVEADALALDLARFGARKLVGNLPYNIAATVVLRALQEAPGIGELTVMTQREVGERLAAAPGSKAYGQTSVMVAFHAEARVAAKVARRAFWPVPAVDSVIVRLARRPETPDVDAGQFSAVVRAAFSQRRKTLRNTLRAPAGSAPGAEAALAAAGISPTARAEEIDVAGYVALSRALS